MLDHLKLAQDLAAHIRNTVKPLLGTPESRLVTGTASSGDATFSIDDAAENAVIEYIERNNINVAYYTEDKGLSEFGKPEATLVIDPVDGSRSAIAGFEMCVVSVAVADYVPDPIMKDVIAGCIYEIKNDIVISAKRGDGVIITDGRSEKPPLLHKITELEKAAWTMEIVGRPADVMGNILSEAIDASSMRGGFFIVNSTAFSLTRLITGQLSAVVDIGGRVIKDLPGTHDAALKAGFGQIVGLFPYDIAAAAMIAGEAGCMITDAWGEPLDEISLLDTSTNNILSIIAACTPELHRNFLNSINNGFLKYS